MGKRARVVFASNQDWTSKGFILENVAKGVLQAIASLTVYALAIWIAIRYSSKFIILGDAVDAKLPALLKPRNAPSNAPANAPSNAPSNA